jgi:hypothetical protein
MDWIIYAFSIGAILIGLLFPSLRPDRVYFLPKPEMNVTRCIELHNEIVRLGWEGMGRSPEDFHPQTWFEHHGQAAQTARGKFSPDLVAFLQGAFEVESRANFHYYATALLYPGDNMFAFIDSVCSPTWVSEYEQHHGDLQEVAGAGRYVRLYFASSLSSHPEGLM